MKFVCQRESIETLAQLAASDRHSVLIEGMAGCGKTYLVKMFAEFLNIPDIIFVNPTVQLMKTNLDACLSCTNPIVLCIENLDQGVVAASHVLLKFLEEPTSNVYVIITCRNLYRIPDTIISRSTVVKVSHPVKQDLDLYAESLDSNKYAKLSTRSVYECIKSFNDIDLVFKLTDVQLNYIEDLKNQLSFNDSVSNIAWKLSHYPDGSDLPISLVIQYIIAITTNNKIRRYALNCIKDLNLNRLGSNAVLSKFIFDCKYA